uniref:Serine aminopeptidase S33 domain-containing protein n=1 Tax=Alexandrium andersonii TaxID=327968 RepID=A0A7S2DQW2_9DINO|mmetsp:Transcript_58110/g.130672  ORF Transcript_58110/g.130672 Transcript_58110/m.130672 type:complete len:390 (+) Transcript_58110:137-1306(+)
MGSNCAVSTSIGCIFCCQGCNAEKLQNAFTFVPPEKSYDIKVEKLPLQSGPGHELVVSSGKLVYCIPGLRGDSSYQQAAERSEVRLLKTSFGEHIPIVWLPRMDDKGQNSSASSGRKSRFVLLHCHGNATDIGMMMGPFHRLSKHLGIDIVGVEYTGYGVSSGTPSVRNSLQDAEAAHAYLVAAGVPSERIIVYGQSVGCGPAMRLASQHQLGGVILHSPMLSGIKVIDPQPDASCKPSCVWHCFDFYPNYRHAKDINCPVFVMHGQKDTIIPFYHGYRLTEAVPEPLRWPGYFPPAAGHNDIIELDTGAYFEKMREFIRCIKQRSDHNAGLVARPSQVSMAIPTNEEPELEAASEPNVGPKDGRYQKLRQGGLMTVVNGGAAREIRAS